MSETRNITGQYVVDDFESLVSLSQTSKCTAFFFYIAVSSCKNATLMLST